MSQSLSEDEIRSIVDGLSKLNPGFLPFDIFRQFTRLGVTPILEVVPLRKNSQGNTDILLLARPVDDPVWPSQLHIPGTVIRATDTPGSFETAFKRIFDEELKGTEPSAPVFVQNIFHHSGRGMETSHVYWAEVRGEPAAGSFYSAALLPENIVTSQLDFIPQAVAAYENRTN